MDENQLISLAIETGETMLKSGAETHRVEDTMERILSVDGKRNPEAFVTATGVFASIQSQNNGPVTQFKRISTRSINLEKITLANSLSRNFTDKKITLEEAMLEIKRINELKAYPYPLTILSYGIVSGCFSKMLGSTTIDAFVAFIVGILLGVFVHLLNKKNVSQFLVSFVGGVFITALALIFIRIGFGQSYDSVIIGSLMPLVPGVAITNAIRDVMGGDYLSGMARVLEAALVAVAIASGAGIALRCYTILLGGVLL